MGTKVKVVQQCFIPTHMGTIIDVGLLLNLSKNVEQSIEL